MSRILFGGSLAPGGLIILGRVGPTTIFNPSGDWDLPPWTLAHPRVPPPPATSTARLETFNHGKLLVRGVYRYTFFIRHAAGAAPVFFDVDNT